MRWRRRRTRSRRALEMQAADRTRPHALRAVTRELPGGCIVVVPAFAAGDRLDSFLQRHGGELEHSRSEWQRLITDDGVRVNGLPGKAGQRVSAGDRVSIGAFSRQLELPPEEAVPFEVVFEDPAMVVINKPAG